MATATAATSKRHKGEEEVAASQRLIGGNAWLRGALICMAVLLVAWAAFRHSAANVTSDFAPDVALGFAPGHSEALATAAGRAYRAGDLSRAEELARASVESSSLSPDGLEVLGLIYGARGNPERAEQVIQYTIRMSRRQIPAQTWMFQHKLVSGDVESALRHIDAAMRVSKGSRATLYPLLAAAIGVDGLHDPVRAMLSRDPEWLSGFLDFATRRGGSLADLASILVALPEDSPARTERVQSRLVNQMVDNGEYSKAAEFVRAVAPAAGTGLVRDSTFERNGSYQPFDWLYSNSTDLRSFPIAAGGIQYSAETGRGGRVARQLVTLAPGAYELTAEGRRLSAGRDGQALWIVGCAGSEGDQLAQLPMSDGGGGDTVRSSTTFVVPSSDCQAQWLDLHLRASFGPGGLQGTVKAVDIRPVSRN